MDSLSLNIKRFCLVGAQGLFDRSLGPLPSFIMSICLQEGGAETGPQGVSSLAQAAP